MCPDPALVAATGTDTVWARKEHLARESLPSAECSRLGVPVGQQSAFLKRRTLGWPVKPGRTWRFPLLQSPLSPRLYVDFPGSVGDGSALGQEVPTTLAPEGHGPGLPLHPVETVNTGCLQFWSLHFRSLGCACQPLNRQQTRSGCLPRGARSSKPCLLDSAAPNGAEENSHLLHSWILWLRNSGWAQLGRPVSPPGSLGLGWGLESSQDSFTPCLMANAGCQLEAWAPFHVDSWCGPAGGSSQHGDWFPQSNHP